MPETTHDLPMSVGPTVAIRALRHIAQDADWRWERFEDTMLVERFAIIMPLSQAARVLGLRLLSGPLAGTSLACWGHTPGSGGVVHTARWVLPEGLDAELARDLVHDWLAHFEHCPWRWSFGERLRLGFAVPLYRRSRRRFAALGVDTSRAAWPLRRPPRWSAPHDEEA